jgi:hypothetical protein
MAVDAAGALFEALSAQIALERRAFQLAHAASAASVAEVVVPASSPIGELYRRALERLRPAFPPGNTVSAQLRGQHHTYVRAFTAMSTQYALFLVAALGSNSGSAADADITAIRDVFEGAAAHLFPAATVTPAVVGADGAVTTPPSITYAHLPSSDVYVRFFHAWADMEVLVARGRGRGGVVAAAQHVFERALLASPEPLTAEQEQQMAESASVSPPVAPAAPQGCTGLTVPARRVLWHRYVEVVESHAASMSEVECVRARVRNVMVCVAHAACCFTAIDANAMRMHSLHFIFVSFDALLCVSVFCSATSRSRQAVLRSRCCCHLWANASGRHHRSLQQHMPPWEAWALRRVFRLCSPAAVQALSRRRCRTCRRPKSGLDRAMSSALATRRR